ncbi:MAG: protein kinase [Candidatus Eisenbacteria bacterium]|nr:protein kinase [Candidatus Eisenbacteria bacterium]
MLTPGTSLGPYKILALIGAGGMGEVYRARDARLDRDVAVKVLPPEVSQDPDRLARFEREAKALAALSHPNILVIHDFGREGEIAYAVTEFLDGENLRHRVGKSALPWREAVETGAAIADALSAAHAAGIVHRDLKPENVFLTRDGRVKVLDFGLARVQRGSLTDLETVPSPPQGTRVGTVLGTVGYMAPEQVRGEPADHRSDIFAFGCVLYEMLTGRRAFRGSTVVDTLSAILKEQPPEITLTHPEVSPELDRVVAHCLEKAPERRFQSAHDIAFDLRSLLTASVVTRPALGLPGRRRWWISAVAAVGVIVVAAGVLLWAPWKRPVSAPALDPAKVVVAPFENRTGDPALDSFGALIPEAVTREAALVSGMNVVPGTSFAGEGGSRPSADALTALARTSCAGLVASGAYYLTGDSLRIQAQLFDAEKGSVILTFDPVTGTQRESASLLESLRQRILGAAAWLGLGMAPGVVHAPTLAAYVEYTLGLESFGRDYETAVAHFARAAALDPDFVMPRMWMWSSYNNQSRCEEAGEVLAELEGHRERLTAVERLWVSGARALQERRQAEALDILRQIEKVASGRMLGLVRYLEGFNEMRLNHPREAVVPLTVSTEQRWARGAPNQWWPRWCLASAYHMLAEYEAELKIADEGTRESPDILGFYARKAAALAALGRLAELDRLVDETLALRARASTAGYVMRAAAAELRAHGDRQASLAMARRAVDWYQARPTAETVELRPSLLDALICAGRWAEAKAIADTLLAESPDDIDRLGSVATLAARLGDAAESRRIAEKLRDRASDCRDGEATYWRACIAVQLGDKREGMALLKEAMARGYGFDEWLHCDIDLEPLWGDAEFQEFLRPKG